MADDREYSNIYTIPPNYTDSGKLMGGMLETRNTVEAGILLALVGYPELMWLHLPVTAKVVVMTITLLPLGVFALMGLGGDSLGSLYVGTVSMVDTTGVFVSLDGGIDCLCTYPKRGRPPRGCRVSVRILGINYESNRIWGVITHMSTVR